MNNLTGKAGASPARWLRLSVISPLLPEPRSHPTQVRRSPRETALGSVSITGRALWQTIP